MAIPPKRLIETLNIWEPWVEKIVYDPDRREVFKDDTPQYVYDAYEEFLVLNEEFQKIVSMGNS